MSFNIFIEVFKAVNLTYLFPCFDMLSMSHGVELAPFPGCYRDGCQGFIGPLPSAFLDKRCIKNCCKDIISLCKVPNKKCKNFVRILEILYGKGFQGIKIYETGIVSAVLMLYIALHPFGLRIGR
jgi:hypothetical protein